MTIAVELVSQPGLLFLDEPTTGLDPITTDKVNSLIKNISSKKTQTTIIVTHEMKIVNEIVNKVVMLHEGNIIFEGSPDKLNSSNDKYIKYFITGKRK